MDGGIDMLRMKHPKRYGKRKCGCGTVYDKSEKYRHNICPHCRYIRKKLSQEEIEQQEKKKCEPKKNRPRTIYANQIHVTDYSRHEVKTIWDMA